MERTFGELVRPAGLLGAARLAPPGSPFGRSNGRRRPFVEPSVFHVVGSTDSLLEPLYRSVNILHFGAPGGIRTHDPRLRRPILYPAELQAHRLGGADSIRPLIHRLL